MTLCMRVSFQADEKHVIQVLLNIRKCDNIKHILFKKNMKSVYFVQLKILLGYRTKGFVRDVGPLLRLCLIGIRDDL